MAKQSKAEANYRDGNLTYHCGLCKNYTGSSCKVVEGTISPYMLSNSYNGHPNPLKDKTPPRFRPRSGGPAGGTGAIPAASSGPGTDDEKPQPNIRIGRKTY
jgi:hypothetical protein